MIAHALPRAPMAVLAQLIADEIILLSTGRRVVPQSGDRSQPGGSNDGLAAVLDAIMDLLDQRLGSRAQAQRWLLTPQADFGGEVPGELVERGSGDRVLALLQRSAG
ncbi:MAG TPA: antitoxin Xre/MbcA/ParS toxin-binding domain-containing protein [Solirubrobacteraceae bacterium]|nr:antitoxin Xre/MbcA/ParS toxin-binding domain-containing protein [Solirubrobacteraceae bacterium]